MALLKRAASLWRHVIYRDRFEGELDEEVRVTFELLVDEHVRAGISAEHARRLAAVTLGVEAVKEQVREKRTGSSIDAWLQDIWYALRALVRRPLISGVAVASLALGIGVNTAIFSVFERLILRSLPVPAPDQLVNIIVSGPRPGFRSTSGGGELDSVISYPLFKDLEQLDDVGLASVFAHRDFRAAVSMRGETSAADALLVSGSYFPAMRLVPALGRLFGPTDDEVLGAHPIVVLSHGYWTTRFGADPTIVGSVVTLNGEPMTIVGVTPAGFTGTVVTEAPDMFVPLTMASMAAFRENWDGFNLRNDHWLYVSGRLSPGVSRTEAEKRLSARFAAITRDVEFPALRRGMGQRDREAFQARQLTLAEGARGRYGERAQTRFMLTVLWIVTGLVLSIASANVANLLLARGTDRVGELALRQSLGASSVRVTRLLMLEALALGLIGGVLAFLVSRATLLGLLSLSPSEDTLPMDVGLNIRVLMFALSVGLVAAFVFGLFPALHSTRASASAAVRLLSAHTSGSRSVHRARTFFAVVQIAIATTLLSEAGLFILSLANIARVDTGMRREGLVMFTVSPAATLRPAPPINLLLDEIETSMRAIPGVLSVSESSIPVLAFNGRTNNLTIAGTGLVEGADRQANYAEIGPDYFSTLGIPLLRGREFTAADDATAPKVAIVNEAFVRKFHLNGSVLGTRMARGEGGERPLDIEIVGVVADARYSDLREAPPPQFFLPYRQGVVGSVTFYVRVEPTNTRAVISMIPAVVSRGGANLLVTRVQTMEDLVWRTSGRDRTISVLSLSFAALATLLAAVGLYAVLAYGVAQRTREMAVRMALGATPQRLRMLVVGEVGRITAIGIGLGLPGAVALGRISRSILFGVNGNSPQILLVAVAIVLTAAAMAATMPGRRAAGVNLAQTLRAD